jgi:hypothetical protein
MDPKKPRLMIEAGIPVGDNPNSMTAAARGPAECLAPIHRTHHEAEP